MRIAVLGGWGASTDLRVSPRERAVLEVLLICRPGDASVDTLAEALWGETPPSTWRKQLQAIIARLRKEVGTAAIVTADSGYRIAPVSAGGTIESDVDDFEASIERARGYSASGEHPRAVTTLERALALWCTRPYEALDGWPRAQDEVARLTELCESARDDLLAAQLAAGDHRSVAESATALVAADPYRERRWHALGVAQYRCERQADALATVRRGQRLLVEELGIDPGPSLVALEDAILRHDEDLLGPPAVRPPSPDCPYKGLAEYTPADADLFFGREEDVAAVLELWDRTGFVTVAGPSGIGKSSLLRAGVVPALRGRGLDPILLAADATPSDVAAGSRTRPLILDDAGPAVQDPERAPRLTAALAAAHAAGVRIVLSVQSRQLDACVAQPAIGALVGAGLHLVAPPTAEAIRAVVEQPALRSGLTVEHGLVDVVLHDAGRVETALPLLSHALAATWERREGSTLTIDAYEATGGLAGAVARSAERVFLNLGSAERDECRALMRRLIEVDAAGAMVLHPAEPSAADATPARALAVARLVSARLVVARADDYALAHEALAREWPRLGAWVEEDAEASRIIAHLSAAAAAWESAGRSSDDLYRGSRLATAIAWRDASGEVLAPAEADFLEASSRAADSARAASAAEADRERRSARRTRILLMASAAAALTAVMLGGFAVSARRATDARERDALITTLTSKTGEMAVASRQVAALLAAELYTELPADARTRAALFDVAAAHPDLLDATVLPGAGGAGGAAIGDDRYVVAYDGAIEAVDGATGATLWSVEAPNGWAPAGRREVAVSADGSTVAVLAEASTCEVTDPCGVLTILDASAGREVASTVVPDAVPVGPWHAPQVAVDLEGGFVATVDRSAGLVEFRDTEDLHVTGSVAVSHARFDAVALAAAGTGEFVVAQPARIRLADPRTGNVRSSVDVIGSTSGASAAVTSDGTLLTAGDRALSAIDPESGGVLWTARLDDLDDGPCTWLTADEHADRIYCAGLDGVVTEWDAATGLATGRTFATPPSHAGPMVVLDGVLHTFGAVQPVVTRWTLTGEGPIRREIARGRVLFDSYNPSGTRLLAAERRAPNVWWDTYTEFASWEVSTDEASGEIRDTDNALAWVGEDAVVAYSYVGRDYRRVSMSDQEDFLVYPIPPLAWIATSFDRSLIYWREVAGEVRAVDVDGGTDGRPVFAVDGIAAVMASSPDGRYVVISTELSEGTVGAQVFDGTTGEPLSSFEPGLMSAAITSDGTVIAQHAGAVARFTKELDLIGTSEATGANVTRVEVSRAGDMFLVSSDDDQVAVYDTVTGLRLAGPLDSDTPFLWPAALRPDGGELAVTTSEGIDVWSLDPDRLLAAACASAGRDLTREEWDTYLAALGGWRSTCGFEEAPGSLPS